MKFRGGRWTEIDRKAREIQGIRSSSVLLAGESYVEQCQLDRHTYHADISVQINCELERWESRTGRR